MNCFDCQEECVMRTEKHMDDTPCSICAWGAEVVGERCRDCLTTYFKCHFQAKTIDIVPVVRCKNCYYSEEHPYLEGNIYCNKLKISYGEDFYCKFGTNANNGEYV